MPSRADLDPLDIPELLKDLILADVEQEPDGVRFRYRLVGTRVEEFIGRSLTGKYLDEVLSPAAHALFVETYMAPFRLKRPVYSATGLRLPDMDYPKVVSRLVLPLSHDGETINMMLNGQSFEHKAGETVRLDDVSDYQLLEMFVVDG